MKLKHLLLNLLVFLALTSCDQKKNRSENSQILRLNLTEDPVSLDPRAVRNLRDLTLVKQLYEGLMRIDQKGIPQPAIAESVEISDDLLTYTFHLREAYWTNRDPVDFARNSKRAVRFDSNLESKLVDSHQEAIVDLKKRFAPG